MNSQTFFSSSCLREACASRPTSSINSSTPVKNDWHASVILMAEFGNPGTPEPLIPKVSQEMLAEMIGTTRSRVSIFMNRFRKLGFIDYDCRIRVHKSLFNVVLYHQLPDEKAQKHDPHSAPRDRLKARRQGLYEAFAARKSEQLGIRIRV